MASKLTNLNTQTRHEALCNILTALFAPRIEALRAHAKQLAQSIQTRSEPEFTAYYQDKKLRPFLQYSTGHTFSYNTSYKDDEGVTRTTANYLATPKMVFEHGAELHIAPQHYYYSGAGALVDVLAHQTGVTPTEDELAQLEAVVAANEAMLGEFVEARQVVREALHSHKTVKSFHEHYPEFKAISGLAESVEQPGKVPAPTHDSIIGKLVSMGLLATEGV